MIYDESAAKEIKRGIQLCRNGYYFDTHDAWEDVWLGLSGRKKKFLHSLIQFVISCYHFENGNVKGAKSMILKSILKAELLLEETRSPLIQSILDLYRTAEKVFSFYEAGVIPEELKQKILVVITDQLLDFENY